MSPEQYGTLKKRKIPVVFFNRYFADDPNNVVYCDPVAQVREVADRLYEFGHRRFANFELSSHCLSSTLVKGYFTYDSGATGLQEILAADSARPTAIICVNDMMAMGCMDEARSVVGLDVPNELSIIGFDGIGMSQFSSYELTTIRQPIGRMCEAAVTMITARIERPEQSSEKRVFEGALIAGGSIAAAP
jgi:DNA-binding LacI/PurR family transcriptional regulator